MLSQSAFNALLKTLEEPPLHVKFIFATTEAYKIAPTIISRCQCFEFKPISEAVIVQKLQQIAQQESIRAEPLALQAIARIADGGMRDAQSIFEQITSFGNNTVTEDDVIGAYGLIPAKDVSALINCVENADYEGIVRWTERLHHCNFWGILSDIEKQLCSNLRTQHDAHEIAQTLRFLDMITTAKDSTRSGHAPEISFQLALFRAAEARQKCSIDRVLTLLKNTKNTAAAVGDDKGTPRAMAIPAEIDHIHGSDDFESFVPAQIIGEEKSPAKISHDMTSPCIQDTAKFDQLPQETREKLKNLFHIEE
jgi:DNA polymerase-3 subunit gamma/tau